MKTIKNNGNARIEQFNFQNFYKFLRELSNVYNNNTEIHSHFTFHIFNDIVEQINND